MKQDTKAASDRLVINGPVAVEEQGEGFHAVLAGGAGNVLITNDVGRYVLDLCRRGTTLREIVSELSQRYPDAPEPRITDDVTAFVETAVAKGALSWE